MYRLLQRQIRIRPLDFHNIQWRRYMRVSCSGRTESVGSAEVRMRSCKFTLSLSFSYLLAYLLTVTLIFELLLLTFDVVIANGEAASVWSMWAFEAPTGGATCSLSGAVAKWSAFQFPDLHAYRRFKSRRCHFRRRVITLSKFFKRKCSGQLSILSGLIN